MERDEILIAIAKLQATQEEMIRRFDDNKAVIATIDERVEKLESSLAWIYGAIALAGFLSTFLWDFVKNRVV